jgi:hypothetical protein
MANRYQYAHNQARQQQQGILCFSFHMYSIRRSCRGTAYRLLREALDSRKTGQYHRVSVCGIG